MFGNCIDSWSLPSFRFTRGTASFDFLFAFLHSYLLSVHQFLSANESTLSEANSFPIELTPFQ